MKYRSLRRPTLLIAGGIAAVAIAIGAAFLLTRRQLEKPPAAGIDPDLYSEMVSAFFAGVAALDADANDHAESELTRATQLVPEEPAAWLDLALLEIRVGDFDKAIRHLERARSLAPESAAVDRFMGLLESRRGQSAEAIRFLREAVRKDPDDVRTLFALAEEIERQGGAEADDEVRKLLSEILKRRPTNAPVLLHQARLAVKAEDLETLQAVVNQLSPLSSNWPESVVERFRQLEDALASGDLRQAALRVTVLRNVLLAEPSFRASIAEVQSPVGVVGEPIESFLKLPMPAPTPSSADLALTFDLRDLRQDLKPAASLVALPTVDGGTPLIVAANGSEVRLLSNGGASLEFPGGAEGTPPGPNDLLAVDWNSDYAIDLVCAGAGGVKIFQQNNDGSFVDATEAAKLDAEVLNAPAVGVWTADIELDGDLDLVLGLRASSPVVLRNNGDGTFAVIRPFEQVSEPTACAWSDFDSDGLPDIAFLDQGGALHVYFNERSGRYSRSNIPEELSDLRAMTSGDQNSDGRTDLVLLRADGSIARATVAPDELGWESIEIAQWKPLPDGDLRLFLADLDNNGALDLLGASSERTLAWLGGSAGALQPLEDQPAVRTCEVLDWDGDGRLDLIGLTRDGAPVRGMNRGTKTYHWQVLRPRGAKVVGDGRINSFGLGGEIQVRSGLLVQNQVIDGPTVHFGLGERPLIDVARIVWPNGTVQAEFQAKVDQVMTAEQRLKGSCPFVFAYDGESMRFVTDFLWRSPLGLRINAQDTAGIAQTEDWIKIRGDQLAEREGYFDVRITAELWETHYFDHVSLMVVDRPRGIEVFVDERFAPSPPVLAIHPTGPLHSITARDDTGCDVTDTLRTADGDYLDTFDRGPYQGVSRDHWVEIELDEKTPRDQPLRLVARGWVHPTDSSINVALSHGLHDPPRGLSLEVPTHDGSWRTVRDGLGFPAGKNKTIVLDLDGLFGDAGPRRFRLRTNLEVFWDQISVAVAEDKDEAYVKRIDPATAELRHRGYSLITQASPGAPELPEYDALIGTAQRWRDLEGYYTRYGDVRELLHDIDDRYVIANAGDELALRFPAPPPPPDGYQRDFVLVGDGWNKDGDFNTAFSATVHPLPSHASIAYDAPPGELKDDPVYRQHAEDWMTYHTRYVGTEDFRRGLRPRPSTR